MPTIRYVNHGPVMFYGDTSDMQRRQENAKALHNAHLLDVQAAVESPLKTPNFISENHDKPRHSARLAQGILSPRLQLSKMPGVCTERLKMKQERLYRQKARRRELLAKQKRPIGIVQESRTTQLTRLLHAWHFCTGRKCVELL